MKRSRHLPESGGQVGGHDFVDDRNAVGSITQLLAEAEEGSEEAWSRIYSVLYQDLHRIARSQIRQQLHPGFSPTSLISEAWLKLVRSGVAAGNRPHLVSLIARAMRFVLIDEARRALTSRHGGGQVLEALSSADDSLAREESLMEMLALDKALESLSRISPRLAKVVELRYYGGLEETEIAELLDLTVRTIRRDWRKARAFLQKHLAEDAPT